MNRYEKLLIQAESYNLSIIEKQFKSNVKGLIKNRKIGIRKGITTTEKTCILAEELGHFHTSSGNILDTTIVNNRKQECIARRWAFKYMISLSDLIDAHKAGCTTLYEVAEHLEITEEFLKEAAKAYESIYGAYIVHQGYRIYFDPLWVKVDEV